MCSTKGPFNEVLFPVMDVGGGDLIESSFYIMVGGILWKD